MPRATGPSPSSPAAKNPTQGHVAFFTDWQDEDTMLILGGNQHDAVSIIAKPATTLLSLRWPRPY